MKWNITEYFRLKSPLSISFFVSFILFCCVQIFAAIFTIDAVKWESYIPYFVAIVGFVFSFLISGIIQIQTRVNPLRTDIKELIDDFEKKLASFKIQTHVNNLGNFISDRNGNDIMYETLSETVRDYLNDLKLIAEREFSVRGQENALIVYATFWRKLVKKQKEINRHNSNQPEESKKRKPIIARITHSNNISLWNEEKNHHATEILKLQKDFVFEGGRFIRFFTIAKERIDDLMKEKIEAEIESQRTEYDLNVWSVPTEHEELDYDYLYLHDDGIVLRWLTTTSGQKLASIQITDNMMDDDRTAKNWEKVWYRCIDLHLDDDPTIEAKLNTIIPKEWQFGEDLL